jgi:plasmid replication initiation protein
MKNNLVTQSNELLNASYTLSLNERRLLLACVAQLDSRKEFDCRTPIHLSVRDATDLFFNEQNAVDAFRQLVQATKTLKSRNLNFFSDDRKRELDTYFVQTIDIDHEKRELKLYFTIGIMPYLTQLKANFTSYKLMNISRLTSVHAMRAYELILMWSCQTSTAHYKEIKVDEFKLLLGLENKYKQIAHLKARVIEPVLKQINENTDFELEIKLKKYTSSFEYIQFFYNKKNAAKEVQDDKKIQPTASTKDLDTKDMFNNLSDRQIESVLNNTVFQGKYALVGETMGDFKGRVKHILITQPEKYADLADFLI